VGTKLLQNYQLFILYYVHIWFNRPTKRAVYIIILKKKR
jgi:hypothetical protein